MTGRGFFGIGVYHPKTEHNIGTLLRSAQNMGAAFVFTVGRRYQKQATDTGNATMHLPSYHHDTLDDLIRHLPHATPLVGVELDPRATMLADYRHPERAAYLLGAEDHGLPPAVIDRCHSLVQIESDSPRSMNVAVAGSIVMYHRLLQQRARRLVRA